MNTLVAILIFGLLMSLIALVGGVALLLKERTLGRILLLLVALSAGSLLGGAFFHMLPAALHRAESPLIPLVWAAAGFVVFLLLEHGLHWHHCHRPPSQHRQPLTYLVLIADGLHNFLGGLAIGAIFVIDVGAGIAAWLGAAAHEVPQELGDFGILVHGGWSARRALLYNLLSALTFPLGALLAYAAAGRIDVGFLAAFGAGSFIYIGAVDLIPELKTGCGARASMPALLAFLLGLGLLLGLKLCLGGTA